jgi:UDP-N-acetylglucosamine--N-acetylmuramyl-(pentapeptide) pyrophosphoryl-undecaprenol N-acetylglucosamine transferase
MNTYMKTEKIIIAGGGTGGHVFPALSISQNLVKQGIKKEDIIFFGSKYTIEKDIIPKKGFRIYLFSGRGINKTKSLKNIVNGIGLIFAFFKSIYLMMKIKPSVVIGVGGYASFPAILSGALLRKKIVVHEQNAVLGRINRFAQKLGATVITTFSHTQEVRDQSISMGLPLRDEVLDQISLRQEYLLSKNTNESNFFNITIFGGSMGARCINNAVIEMFKECDIPQEWNITLITGEKNLDAVNTKLRKENIVLYPFVDNLFELICKSDLVISRAGAGSCVEIEIAGVKSILIPLAIAPEDHQTKNAQDLANNGFGSILTEKELNGTKLFEHISTAQLQEMDVDSDNKNSIHILAGVNIAKYIIENYTKGNAVS